MTTTEEIAAAEKIERERAVAEIRSWLETPYIKGGRVKGVGVDCVTLIAEAAIACGMVRREDLGELPVYSHDWWCHKVDDLYLLRLLRHAAKVAEGRTYITTNREPGNLVLAKVQNSRVFNHGGVITDWPKIVHAIMPKVEEVNISTHWMWAQNEIVILDGWAPRRTA